MDAQVKRLIRKLGQAIHNTVTSSEDVSGVVQQLREQGFDVLLMLEATIGLNQMGNEETDGETTEATYAFTEGDISFLRSLRIALPVETGATPPAAQAG
jgi:hypothetical protein